MVKEAFPGMDPTKPATTTRLRIELPFTDEQLEILIGIAIRRDFMLGYPRRLWRDSERKAAARYAMERLISHGISEYKRLGKLEMDQLEAEMVKES